MRASQKGRDQVSTYKSTRRSVLFDHLQFVHAFHSFQSSFHLIKNIHRAHGTGRKRVNNLVTVVLVLFKPWLEKEAGALGIQWILVENSVWSSLIWGQPDLLVYVCECTVLWYTIFWTLVTFTGALSHVVSDFPLITLIPTKWVKKYVSWVYIPPFNYIIYCYGRNSLQTSH